MMMRRRRQHLYMIGYLLVVVLTLNHYIPCISSPQNMSINNIRSLLTFKLYKVWGSASKDSQKRHKFQTNRPSTRIWLGWFWNSQQESKKFGKFESFLGWEKISVNAGTVDLQSHPHNWSLSLWIGYLDAPNVWIFYRIGIHKIHHIPAQQHVQYVFKINLIYFMINSFCKSSNLFCSHTVHTRTYPCHAQISSDLGQTSSLQPSRAAQVCSQFLRSVPRHWFQGDSEPLHRGPCKFGQLGWNCAPSGGITLLTTGRGVFFVFLENQPCLFFMGWFRTNHLQMGFTGVKVVPYLWE